ncbi:hypothetical protein JB92DRAFT_3088842 [Gautieria morchelliformis]|nr:hypothetical protein JB92DRAFT_3088842 [Gautieria morchelliformis]
MSPKAPWKAVVDLSNFVDLTQTSLHIELASISFNPIWWNVVAQNVNAHLGCRCLAVAIFTLGVFRETLFYPRALKDQPNYPLRPPLYATLVTVLLFSIGQTFGFPFNVVEKPMYIGSTLCFAAGALWYEKPAGLLITAYVYIVYSFALRYEGPFTEMIYASRGNGICKKGPVMDFSSLA